ncbi:MAG: nicotinate phosphoribosyltransferase [Nitrosomonadaceae bacterium]|nr:nicotinate phosphoribosyltransferase [Nitrosomonadaceae bacterium]
MNPYDIYHKRPSVLKLTDSYKWTHGIQEEPGTTNTYSYFESRNGAKYPVTKFFGLQMLLKKYLCGPVVTHQDVNEADGFGQEHFMGATTIDTDMWHHVADRHGGNLPLCIRAVPEGSSIPVSNVLMDVFATDPKCASLTNFFESLLTHVWGPSNVATISGQIRNKLAAAFKQSVDDDVAWLLDYMLHDFGFRGVSSVESAGLLGAGHLINFRGTDTLIAIDYAQMFYPGAGMAANSVIASEHSIMTARGPQHEYMPPGCIYSMVSDSYNIDKLIEQCGTIFKAKIVQRGGKLVFRPDSPRFKGETPEQQVLALAQTLEKHFGATTNKKGYKVLHPSVGLIYGDGLSIEDIFNVIDTLLVNGFAASTCVFGMGGGLLQKHNRDTQRSAFKCAAKEVNGVWNEVYKEPLDKTKASKRGWLRLEVDTNGAIHTVQQPFTGGLPPNDANNLLQPVFKNGELLVDQSWADVCQRARTQTVSLG